METTPAPAEVAQSTVSPQEKGNGAATSVPESFSPTLTLQEIVALERPLVVPQVGRLLDATEICLFTARQKEGKSTLGLQLAIDVSIGDPLFGQFPTKAGTVLYVDYENRLDNLKKRGEDLLQGPGHDLRLSRLHLPTASPSPSSVLLHDGCRFRKRERFIEIGAEAERACRLGPKRLAAIEDGSSGH